MEPRAPTGLAAITRADYRTFRSMRAADIPIWRAHLALYNNRYLATIYGAKVGGTALIPETFNADERRQAEELLAKRPDALALTTALDVECIEVKPRGTFAAVGQALGYARLTRETLHLQPAPTTAAALAADPLKPLRGIRVRHYIPTLVCAWMDPDALSMLLDMGGRAYEYPALANLYDPEQEGEPAPD